LSAGVRCHEGFQLPYDDLPIIAFQSSAAWEEWLEHHHAGSRGLWLKIAKKATGLSTVTVQEAIEAALCFGWIDGQRQTFDDQWFLQRFTPRRPRSRWSQINRDKVETLIERGLMRPAGLKEIERAKADGRWADAYPSPTKMELPDDLRRSLEENPRAAEAFAALNATSRYSILYRVHHIKAPAARARRIEEFVAMLTRGDGV
jgi:uncharacterized protein YdeI (YjbR/CyaY-like superfamily)